jgi:hypothetical protein
MSDPSTRTPGAYAFEDWRHLYATDPEAFELRRREALDAVIQSAPASLQPRLRGMQFRIDLERARAGSGLAACIKAHSMMWDSLVRLRDALAGLSDLQKDGMLGSVARRHPAALRTAAVIPFPRVAASGRSEGGQDGGGH